ncbi:hypothetical protein SGFS_044200 [Streptomyces graminofaciens]|uniref:Small CPxCG-related zinc finger protein n=1 Tax=Streptomyces graminofaciens TaxID=68212 RepID=A0ABN5VJD7_9ACTN|nr:hypothetical protein [Streptomyces graminofaciens]BBC33126.1 hypothetical protein SGFS_044200 [Streptomyces graminofaciens]
MTSLSGGDDSSGSAVDPQTLVCANCGATTEDPQPLWTCSVENGRRHYLCETCARENLRAIEGRLDLAWW